MTQYKTKQKILVTKANLIYKENKVILTRTRAQADENILRKQENYFTDEISSYESINIRFFLIILRQNHSTYRIVYGFPRWNGK